MDIGFLLTAAAVAGLLLAVHLWEKRQQASRELTEAELLFLLARITETSEFEQFRRAAGNWNHSRQKAEADFNRYLLQGELPHYVRDYLRRAQKSDPALQSQRGDFFSGVLLEKRQHDPGWP
ncbi:MAG: hypothetical protein R6U22_06185 [Desulfohalobiaceae bacterium]